MFHTTKGNRHRGHNQVSPRITWIVGRELDDFEHTRSRETTMKHTIANSSTNKASQREQSIEYTVCRIRECNILSTTGTKIGHSAEHSGGGETKEY